VSRRNAKQSTLHNLTDMGRAAERTAAAGWHDLAEAFDSAAGRTHAIADGTRDRVGSLGRDVRKRGKDVRKRGESARKRGLAARDEAYRRGTAARDALSGRRTHTWRWVAAAAAAGLAAGATVVEFGRRLIQSREQAQLEKIEQTVADVTSDPAGASSLNGSASATMSPASTEATKPMPTAKAPTES
jgi:hypothetical protein